MEDRFSDRLARAVTEIKNMKMNQVIGGDSWVVYRAEAVMEMSPYREYLVIFSPESNNQYVAVCKITTPDRTVFGSIAELMPDPNIAGRWWVPTQFSGSGPIAPTPQTIFIYSTVKGSVSVQDVTGQDAGTTA